MGYESKDPEGAPRGEPAEYDNVVFGGDRSGNALAVRPNELLIEIADPQDLDGLGALLQAAKASIRGVSTENIGDDERVVFELGEAVRGNWRRVQIGEDIDVVQFADRLREQGTPTQPNHVYFLNSIRPGRRTSFPNMLAPNMLAPNMLAPNMLAPNMLAPNMLAPNMLAPNMLAPNMLAARGFGGLCCCSAGADDGELGEVPRFRARPANAPGEAARATKINNPMVDLYVIDGPTGSRIESNNDGYVDPVIRHGEFVANIATRHCGIDADLTLVGGPLGDVSDAELVAGLQRVVALRQRRDGELAAGAPRRSPVLNLSLSGYNEDDRPSRILADQIKAMVDDDWLIVAAAGNGGSCRRTFPATLPGVVSVGAYGPNGPAPFSNYGNWVDCSGPGVDVHGEFPDLNVGDAESQYEPDQTDTEVDKRAIFARDFNTGWATWSGTSFAAPFVTARLAAALHIARKQSAPGQLAESLERAIDEVLGDADLPRFLWHGVVVT